MTPRDFIRDVCAWTVLLLLLLSGLLIAALYISFCLCWQTAPSGKTGNDTLCLPAGNSMLAMPGSFG